MGEGDGTPAVRASDADREAVAETVRRAVGEGRLTMVEGDERQASAYAATFRHELAPLVADLPDTTAPAATPTRPASSGDRPETTWSVAVLGGAERTGPWTPGRTHRAVSVMGGQRLDLRRARTGDGPVAIQTLSLMGGMEIDLRGVLGAAGGTVTALAFMGGAEIVVDPDTTVEVVGIGFLGGFGDDAGPAARPDGPHLRVDGFAMFGGVSVTRRPLALEG